MRLILPLIIIAVILTSCVAPASPRAATTALPPATVTETIPPSETPSPTATTPTPTPTLRPSPAPSPTAETCAESTPLCITSGHFWFIRPLDPSANLTVDRTYPYATNQNGAREVHHGVEFANAQGTPVLAAADGTVVFAGNDKLTLIAWVTAFYGNVIVLEHHLNGQVLYTLYGHLYKIDVTAGDTVRAGQKIGEVGATGTAIGSHLHFEVRSGMNNYKSTRNPELWVAPVAGTGVVAGSVRNGNGDPVKAQINIQKVENGQFIPISLGIAQTYAQDTINSDDLWRETFTFGGLPVGEYRLSLVHYAAIYEQVIKIEDGKLTLVRFVVK